MKSSILVAATSAMLAMASPLEKRKMETTVVVEYQTVTVTGSGEEEAKPTLFWGNKHRPAEVQQSTTEVTNPVVIVTVTPEAPAPEPTTAEPTTTTYPDPVVIVTQTEQAQAETTKYPTEEPVEEPATPSSTTSSSELAEPTEPAGDDMPSAAIYHHNLHRSNHSAPEMEWDDKIAGYAANTAATCKFAHDMTQGDGGYGQNLAMWAVSDGAADLGEAGAIKMATTNMWYNGELDFFKPEYYGEATPDMSQFESWGHLTQLLWKSSTELGCAAQFCAKGSMYDDMDAWLMVCNYGPPGNVGGAYATNMLKSLGKANVVA